MGRLNDLADRLRAAGCVAAEDEARELTLASGGDPALLAAMVERRVSGEPLAWVTGAVDFLGARVRVDRGVYVPRWQTEVVAERAAARMPTDRPAVAVDLCTGSGAVAVHLLRSCAGGRVVATDVDPLAVACARANGVDARLGDLDAPLDGTLMGQVDVLVAVPPYVPSGDVRRLARDARDHEPRRAVDGGGDGLDVLRRIGALAPQWLRDGGALLVELGGDQAGAFGKVLASCGFDVAAPLRDPEGDPCGVEATFRRETQR